MNHQIEFDLLTEHLAELCQAEAGRARVAELTPLTDADAIRERLRLTAELQLLLRRGHSVDLAGVSDVTRLLRAPEHRVYGFEECRRLCGVVLAGNRLPRALDEADEFPLYTAILRRVTPLPDIERRWLAIYSPEGEILDSASSALAAIRKRRRNVRTSIYDTLQKRMGEVATMLSDTIVTERNDRYVIPVKQGSEKFVPGMVQGRSGSKATVFVEPAEVVGLNNELKTLSDDEHEEILRILTEFTDQLREQTNAILANQNELGRLDYFFAAARLGNQLDATVPRIVPEARLRLEQARHPLLILQKGRAQVIPFDLELGGQTRLMVISGPNTGGKTVTLKATGLLTMMALCGLPIPAADVSEVGMFHSFFADIGDSQSLAGALSTFSAHVRNLQIMLERGDERSLILADEIGSATDPEQGSALAQAMLERLVEQQVIGLVTTHYTALKVFAEQHPACVNASMHFDPDRHTPTYQFKLGLPGNSFAIEVAEHLGLDAALIARARGLAGSQNLELTELLAKMVREKQELARQSYEMKLKNSLLTQRTGEYERKLAELEHDRKETQRQMLQQAREWLNGLQRDLQAEVEDIRKAERGEQKARLGNLAARTATRQRELADQEKQLSPSTHRKLEKPVIGQTVWVEDFEDSGEIVELGRDKIRVSVRGFTYSTTLDRLSTAPRREQPITGGGVQGGGEREGSALELMLIGKTFDEAEPELAAFLDNAVLLGLGKVRIVHGKGTGALRSKVRAYLRRHRKVTEFYAPPQESGGDGVTVVSFV